MTLIGVFVFFLRRRSQRKRRAPPPTQDPHEKAQLHADDLKPDRKELEGTKASRALLERKGNLAEMPANEEVERKDLPEMNSNQIVGNELETTENEMRVLDRQANTG